MKVTYRLAPSFFTVGDLLDWAKANNVVDVVVMKGPDGMYRGSGKVVEPCG